MTWDLFSSARRAGSARLPTRGWRSARWSGSRGFALPTGADGRILRYTADLQAGREFDLRVSEGEVPCRVTG